MNKVMDQRSSQPKSSLTKVLLKDNVAMQQVLEKQISTLSVEQKRIEKILELSRRTFIHKQTKKQKQLEKIGLTHISILPNIDPHQTRCQSSSNARRLHSRSRSSPQVHWDLPGSRLETGQGQTEATMITHRSLTDLNSCSLKKSEAKVDSKEELKMPRITVDEGDAPVADSRPGSSTLRHCKSAGDLQRSLSVPDDVHDKDQETTLPSLEDTMQARRHTIFSPTQRQFTGYPRGFSSKLRTRRATIAFPVLMDQSQVMNDPRFLGLKNALIPLNEPEPEPAEESSEESEEEEEEVVRRPRNAMFISAADLDD
ncbi:uncharacterized protein LOC106173910 [Lingula anatina]|uniref:Uncharacterized protein LOC106173910 n=1 Tax=Lingula anatina TaxID=7574 RepID=A0A1S3JK00_LINAN|nr:uncharacterized protein LOC106173910 [Lingula anatina]XP_013410698.1 uncharacterized protein LOC106173910 [Lingula anatina]|eukprot:XP_013410696.1 uncharacterized protein LOC106173910 [Lingula anatina]